MPLDKNKTSKPALSSASEVISSGRLQTIATSCTTEGVMHTPSVTNSQYLVANRAMSALPAATHGNIMSADVASSCLTCQQTAVSRQQCHHHHHHHHYNSQQKQKRLFPTGSAKSLIQETENSTTCSSSGGENISLNQPKCHSASPSNGIPSTSNTSSALPPALKVRLYELFGQIEREFEVLYSDNLGLQERLDQLSNSGLSNILPGSASTSTISTLTNNLHLLNDINLNNQSPTDYGNKPLPQQMYAYSPIQSTLTKDPNHVDLNLQQQNHGIQPQSFHKFQQSQQHPYQQQPPSHMQQLQQPPIHQKYSRVHKLRSHTNRLRQQTTRIMSNFASKGPSGSSSVNCTPLRR